MKTKTSFILILIVVLVAATYFGAFDNHEETLSYHPTWKNCVFTAHPTNPVEGCADANPKTELPNDT